jgi:GntR family transcriptional regulator
MFRVQPGSGEPIYQQLVRQVKHSVATGVLSAGSQLPTVRELAAELVVNPNTVARAYRELERDGVLDSVRGRGTFVRTGPPMLGRAERRRRLRPVLEQVIAEARTLGFADADLVDELERVLGLTFPASNAEDR